MPELKVWKCETFSKVSSGLFFSRNPPHLRLRRIATGATEPMMRRGNQIRPVVYAEPTDCDCQPRHKIHRARRCQSAGRSQHVRVMELRLGLRQRHLLALRALGDIQCIAVRHSRTRIHALSNQLLALRTEVTDDRCLVDMVGPPLEMEF